MYHKEQDTQELPVEKDKVEKDKGTYIHKYVTSNLHVRLYNVHICTCVYGHTLHVTK